VSLCKPVRRIAIVGAGLIGASWARLLSLPRLIWSRPASLRALFANNWTFGRGGELIQEAIRGG